MTWLPNACTSRSATSSSDFYSDLNITWNHKTFIKSNNQSVDDLLQRIDEPWDTVVKPRMKSFMASNPDAAINDPLIRQEYTMSAKGVTAWLLYWASSRKFAVDRRRANAMLAACFVKLLDMENLGLEAFRVVVDQCKDTYMDYDVISRQPCYHLHSDLRRVLQGDAQRWAWEDVVESMTDLSRCADCAAAPAALGKLIQVMSLEAEENAPNEIMAGVGLGLREACEHEAAPRR